MKIRRSTAVLAAASALVLAAAMLAFWVHFRNPERLLRLGEQALARGDTAIAERYVSRLQGSHPAHAHLLRAELLIARQEPKPALAEIAAIGEEETDLRVRAAAALGVQLVGMGVRAQAEQLLRYVLMKDPDHRDAHRGLAALYYDQGAYTAALEQVDEWLRLSPNDGAAHRFAGIVYRDMQETADKGWNKLALEHFRQALTFDLEPSIREETKIELAGTLIRETDYPQALAVLESLEETTQKQEKAAELKGECLFNLNRVPELSSLLASAAAQYPHNAALLWLQARQAMDAGHTSEAASLLESALAHDRHDERCRNLLSQVYRALGRPRDAAEQRRLLEQTQKYIADLGRLAEQAMESPWDAALRFRLAETCEKLDRYDEAVTWRRSAAACQQTAKVP
jgi:tetratricopeptide (TPR) repeat protein